MERVNLNLPSDVRQRLRALARKLDLTEGELARHLVLRALEGAEREQLRQTLTRVRTEERRARDRMISRALERLHGCARRRTRLEAAPRLRP